MITYSNEINTLITQTQNELTKAKSTQSQLQATKDANTRLLSQLLPLLDEVSKFNFKQTEEALAEWNATSNKAAVLLGHIGNLEKLLKKRNEQFLKVKEGEEKAERQLQLKQTIETVREVFHRDKLPAAITRTYFASINHVWNELLSQLEVPFSAHFTDNFDIILSFPTGNAVVDQASGGQQCCAALTFVLAVSRLFASQIGFIVLDEPTYGLDSDRIDRVTNLLHSLQGYAMNNSLQIICVTHEERLKTGFEHIITL